MSEAEAIPPRCPGGGLRSRSPPFPVRSAFDRQTSLLPPCSARSHPPLKANLSFSLSPHVPSAPRQQVGAHPSVPAIVSPLPLRPPQRQRERDEKCRGGERIATGSGMEQVRRQHLRKVRAGSGDAPGVGGGDQGYLRQVRAKSEGTPGLGAGTRITPRWERGAGESCPSPLILSSGAFVGSRQISRILGNCVRARGQSEIVGRGMGHFVPTAPPEREAPLPPQPSPASRCCRRWVTHVVSGRAPWEAPGAKLAPRSLAPRGRCSHQPRDCPGSGSLPRDEHRELGSALPTCSSDCLLILSRRI